MVVICILTAERACGQMPHHMQYRLCWYTQEHSTYRRCKQLFVILQTLGNTSTHPQYWIFCFICLFICSAWDPHSPLLLTFYCLSVICSAPLHSLSWNLCHLYPTFIHSSYPNLPFLSVWTCHSLYFHTPSSHAQRTHLSSTTFHPRLSPCTTFIISTFVPSYSKAILTFTCF